MDKLGIKIVLVSSGAHETYLQNDGDWSKKADDDLFLGYVSSAGDAFYKMSFDESGCYFRIIKPISGRVGDCVIAWIFIPSEIAISGQDISDVIMITKNSISQPTLDKGGLDEQFQESYGKNSCPMKYKPSTQEDKYAFRYFGTGADYNLAELLDSNKIYQSYYSKYKAIFLIDKASKVTPTELLEDITNEPIKETYVFDIKDIPQGVKVSIDKQPFKNAIRVPKDTSLTLSFKRNDGFEASPSSVLISKDTIYPIPNNLVWKKSIQKSDFTVFDETGTPIEDYTLKVNNLQITGKHFFSETEWKNASISISADGYKIVSTSIDMSKPNNRRFQLEKKPVILELPDESRWEGNSNNIKLKGYHVIKSNNHYGSVVLRLEKEKQEGSMKKWLKRIAILVGISLALIGLGLGIGYFLWHINEDSANTGSAAETERASEIPQTPEENQQTKPDPQTVEYGVNSIWKKNEMDNRTHELKGLWDQLNEYQFDEILARIEKFKNYENWENHKGNWEKLNKAIHTAKRNGFVPPQPTYCLKKEDTEITIDTYIKTITTRPSPQPANNPDNAGTDKSQQENKINEGL